MGVVLSVDNSRCHQDMSGTKSDAQSECVHIDVCVCVCVCAYTHDTYVSTVCMCVSTVFAYI